MFPGGHANRSRVGAVAAAALIAVFGGGGLLTSDAAGAESSFVAVTPARVLDTRVNLGLSGPFTSETARLLTVTGSIPTADGTMTVVPTGATAVVMNVTVVLPTAAGFFSVRPGTAAGVPGTSNLNFGAGAIVPNAVTVELAPDGSVNLFYFGGSSGATTDLLIDIVGYFTEGGEGPPGEDGDDGEDAVLGPDQGRTIAFSHTVDNSANVGQAPSIAIGVDGLPVIAYRKSDTADLMVAHCSDTSCTNAVSTAHDTANESGQEPALTIGVDGLPIIAHQLTGGGVFDLRVTHCDNVACTTATHTTVDSTGDTGWTPSITIGADGLPIIAHHRSAPFTELRVTHCSNVVCTSSTTTAVDTDNIVGVDPSITIGTDGFAVIAHQDQTSFDLRVTHCTNTACTAATHTAYDIAAGNVGGFPSVAIGTDGFPVIAHFDDDADDLVVTHCGDVACTSATHRSADTVNNVGNRPSITIGVDGFPVIAHRDNDNDELRLTQCSDLTCTSAVHIVLDTLQNVGNDASLTIGADAQYIVAHFDATNSSLKVSKLQNMSWTVNGWES